MTKIEQIRASLANMDSEIIKDTLSIILAKESVKTDTAKTEISSNYKNFAQAILSLKSKYKFAELDFFSVEADLVYVTAGDRRVLLTDKDNIMQNTAFPQSPVDSELPPDETDDTAADANGYSTENAFEPIRNNESRFSHLEL